MPINFYLPPWYVTCIDLGLFQSFHFSMYFPPFLPSTSCLHTWKQCFKRCNILCQTTFIYLLGMYLAYFWSYLRFSMLLCTALLQAAHYKRASPKSAAGSWARVFLELDLPRPALPCCSLWVAQKVELKRWRGEEGEGGSAQTCLLS